MAVAKSFQHIKTVGEPFYVNGRQYIKLETGKQVRWYTDAEYAKMYGTATPKPAPKTQKEALGFENGFITIFKGDTYAAIDWFRASVCRYNKFFGWYCPSSEDIPNDLPIGIEPIRVEWDAVCAEDGVSLGLESKVKAYVESLVCEPSSSEYIGEVKERIEIEVIITKAVPLDGYYGRSTMHIMEDANGNVIVWNTSAKTLVEGNNYTLRGTIKAHSMYKNVKQTVLTRCTVLD